MPDTGMSRVARKRAGRDPVELQRLADALGDRVLVLGCPGSGKTTVSVRLAEAAGLACTHLDDEYFGPQWSVPDEQRWHARLAAVTSGDRWVLDGNHAASLPVRLRRATGVLLVDEWPPRCLYRYLRRSLGLGLGPADRLPAYMRGAAGGRRRVVHRPLHFARFILTFRARTLPVVLAVLDQHPSLPVVRLTGTVLRPWR